MKPDSPSSASTPAAPTPLASYGATFIVCALTTAVALPLHVVLDLANIVMLFLLTVFLVATFLGRGPAVMASFLCVACFDFFLVPPQLSFDVADTQYLVTFAVMLAVGLVTAHLVSRLAEQTRQACAGERQIRQLYAVALDMAGAHTRQQVVEAVRRYLERHRLHSNLLVAANAAELEEQAGSHHALGAMETGFAQSARERNEIIEVDSLAGTGIAIAYFPLRAPSSVCGVLAITPATEDTEELHRQRQAIEALASLTALALERLHYAEATRQAELQIAEERLRTSVLSSLSHDLRTPLTTLVGLADTLTGERGQLPAEIGETAAIIRDQAQAMHRLLSDLLDMARLQGTHTALRREWQPFEDVVGSSLRLTEGGGASPRHVALDLPADLPLLCFDAVLIERVLCNLLDNAFKYAPPGAAVRLSARLAAAQLEIAVCNDGPGFPAARLESIFDLFVRGHDEPSIPGVGLGLAICKAIVVAHGGTIRAENVPGGACVRFTLPCETPPPIEEEAG